MNKIKWCLKAKNGLELIKPNEDLTKAYLKKAENSLRAAATLKDNKDWEISSSYYTMYFSLYAILMKIGIKCEIHSCTISFMHHFLNKYFTDEEIELIEKSQKARIDTQYYSDRNISDELYKRMINNTALFLAKCKEILNKINEDSIQKIRDDLEKV
ncbi:MAG: HEPN domain-containing protein [Nanoarchaeota archaeon]|nr:HEPN domain-containing protein [Nanoarchaeota archaeon]